MLVSPDTRQDDPCAQSGQNPALTSFFRPFSPSPPTISPRQPHKLTINFEQHDKPDTQPRLTSKPPQRLPLTPNVTSEQNMLSKERVPGACCARLQGSSLRFAQSRTPRRSETLSLSQKDRNSSPGKDPGEEAGAGVTHRTHATSAPLQSRAAPGQGPGTVWL